MAHAELSVTYTWSRALLQLTIQLNITSTANAGGKYAPVLSIWANTLQFNDLSLSTFNQDAEQRRLEISIDLETPHLFIDFTL